MKIKKSYIASLALAAVAFAACDKDGDMIYVDKATDVEISSAATDIVLDINRLDMLALTVYWNGNGDISLSDTLVAAPQYAFTNSLQLSASEDFAQMYEETMPDGVCERQFSTAQLNSAAIRGGMESGTTAKVYIRIKSVLGANIAPRYSNVLTVNLTTYMVDMTLGTILDSSKNDSGRTLAVTGTDNVFAGFIGAASWENWFFRDPSGEVWGTASDPGQAFILGKLSTDAELWSLWFPEAAGCYYTTVNIPANEWTALLVNELSLTGDINGEMAFDRKANRWTYTFNAEAKTYNFSIAGNGSLYDHNGGDGAPSQTGVSVGFSGQSDALVFGNTASPVSLNIAAAGETTLILDLNNPKQFTITTGEVAPSDEVAPYIYLPGIVDPWGFEDYLTLYNEDEKSYAGVHYIDSQWGYQIAIEKDNWTDIYTMVAGGSPFEGKLEFQGKDNIAASDAGIYLLDVSLGWLSYKVTKVNSVSYTGLNDDWNFHAMTASADDPCVFTAEVEKTANTPWGVKICINESWELFFGGNGTPGELCYGKDGFEGDNDFENGTLILTVDLARGTYSYQKK